MRPGNPAADLGLLQPVVIVTTLKRHHDSLEDKAPFHLPPDAASPHLLDQPGYVLGTRMVGVPISAKER